MPKTALRVAFDQEAFLEEHRQSLQRQTRDTICDIHACQMEFWKWSLPTANPEGRLWSKREIINRILGVKDKKKLVAFLKKMSGE